MTAKTRRASYADAVLMAWPTDTIYLLSAVVVALRTASALPIDPGRSIHHA